MHAEAPSWAATDWKELVALYDLLAKILPTPIVALNRAVAVGELRGAAAGLAAVEAIGGLDTLHLWHAARADMLRRLDRPVDAARAYRSALACRPGDPERRFLERRLSDISDAT